MAGPGKYLYCIIRCSEERTFDEASPMGGEKAPVHTVPYNGLAAVASDSTFSDGEYAVSRLNMIAHQKVLETVMPDYTLLPVRFGTVANSASPIKDIRKLLEGRFQDFNRLLQEMEGKVEVGLKAFWRNEKAVFEEIVAENADIRKLRNSLSGKPAERIRFDGIPLGRRVKEALDHKRSQEAARILLPLRPAAHRVRENDILSDRLIVNAAFLVGKEQEQKFDQAVRRLDEELGDRVAFKYVGPVPPYNFVEIVVKWQEL
ncbi:MAG: GvpL/GvpF family gas vesicle protein [Chloroflexota bacterium]|nr:GvpL/GvpF family gas vesicle protein [Chloroflexota bacterium]